MELNVAMSHLQLGVLNLRSALQKCSVTSEVEEAALAIVSEIRELTGHHTDMDSKDPVVPREEEAPDAFLMRASGGKREKRETGDLHSFIYRVVGSCLTCFSKDAVSD